MNADKFWKSKEVTILQPHDSFACFLVGLWGPICGIVDFCHSQNKYWHFGLVFQTNSQAHLPSCLYGHYLIVFFLDYNLKNELLHSNCVTMSITITSHCNQ